ncbi:MAG: DUF2764 domain-containing protein [Prevotellaceae bacterium]|jgi:hypothetical protein|nr:DUF2764 domain-containing protein [Prevotellaceae bacterium]
MSKYYYLVAGLPDLTLDQGKPTYSSARFMEEIYPALSKHDRRLIDLHRNRPDETLFTDEERAGFEEDKVLMEDRLAARYYVRGMQCGNRLVASWFEFNLNLKNILVALIARKHKLEVAPFIVGDTPVAQALRTSSARDFSLGTELDYLEPLLKISETEELLEREKRIDQLRWRWMEEATFFHYFSVERLFVFLMQLEMVERWLLLDKEQGSQLFRSLIAGLKQEVRIPAEFKK